MPGMPNRLGAFLCLAAILAVVSGPVSAQAWKKHSYPADGFEVEFSGTVDTSREDLSKLSAGRAISEARYTQNTKTGGYAVWVTTLAEPNAAWEEASYAAFGAIGCQKVLENRVLEVSGRRVLHLSGVGCIKGVLSVTARFTQVGPRIYQLLAIYPPTAGESDSAQRFMNSFAILAGKE